MIKLPTLSPRSVQLAFFLSASEISPRIVFSLFPLKSSWFKSKPDKNLEGHGGCCSCTLKKWLLKEIGSAMTGHLCWFSAPNLSLAPAISEQSHLMVSVCDTHRYLLPHAGPAQGPFYMPSAGLLFCLAGTHAGVRHGLLCHICLQKYRQTWSRAAPRQGSCSTIIPTPLATSAPALHDSTCTPQLLQWQWNGLWAAGISMVFPKISMHRTLYTHGLSHWSNFVHAFARGYFCYCPGKLPISLISYSWPCHTNGSLHNRPW